MEVQLYQLRFQEASKFINRHRTKIEDIGEYLERFIIKLNLGLFPPVLINFEARGVASFEAQ